MFEVDGSVLGARAWEMDLNHSEENSIEGTTEYSYGMWTRFRYNSAEGKILQKPSYNGLVRLTSNKGFSDCSQLGDRSLATWIGPGHYYFGTHDVNSNICDYSKTIDYGVQLDNKWVYVYFGYKRVTESQGMAVAYLYYQNGGLVQTLNFDVLHRPLTDFIHFQAGSASSSRNDYANFNGQITKVMFGLKEGAFLAD